MFDFEDKKPIAAEIRMTSNSIRKYIDKTLSESCGIDLTGTEVMTLFFILRHSDANVTSKMVMDNFMVSKSSVSEMLNCLVSKGYITMEIDQEDKRTKFILLTDEGKKVHKKFKEILSMIDKKITNGISADDEKVTRDTLHKIIANIGAEQI